MWQSLIIKPGSITVPRDKTLCHARQEAGGLKSGPEAGSVLTQEFSESLPFGEEVKGAALSFLLGL